VAGVSLTGWLLTCADASADYINHIKKSELLMQVNKALQPIFYQKINLKT
jgi:hypothetical protein